VLGSYFAQKGVTHRRGGTGAIARAGNMSNGTCMREDGARGSWASDLLLLQGEHGNWGCFDYLLCSVVLFSLLSWSLIKSSC
jgi:hypothetical protein